jgi:hypothetical protein
MNFGRLIHFFEGLFDELQHFFEEVLRQSSFHRNYVNFTASKADIMPPPLRFWKKNLD